MDSQVMFGQLSLGSAARSLPGTIDVKRLHDAQAYLRSRQHRETPSAAEEEAWQWFCEMYEPLLAHWAKRYGLTCEELADCLQEIRLDILRHLPHFVPDGRFLCSWLRAIVRAKAVDLLRYKKRRPFTRLDSADELALVSRAGPATEYGRERRQEVLMRLLVRLRQKINPIAFQAFSMHWLERKKIAETAAALRCSERAVRRYLSKAKRVFGLLADSDEDRDCLTDY